MTENANVKKLQTLKIIQDRSRESCSFEGMKAILFIEQMYGFVQNCTAHLLEKHSSMSDESSTFYIKHTILCHFVVGRFSASSCITALFQAQYRGLY